MVCRVVFPLVMLLGPAASSAVAGYCHYYTWQQTPDENKLRACIADMRRIIEASSVPLSDGEGEGGKPFLTPLELHINGVGEDAHEPFVFPSGPGFNFVKTNGKPYDVVVVACLLAARDHFGPDELIIESDGRWRDSWAAGAALYQGVLGRRAQNPLSSGQDTAWDYLPTVMVLSGGLLVVWLLLRPNAAFIVRIQNGTPRVRKGHVAAVLLAELAAFCAEHQLQSGTVYGIRLRGRVALAFSRNVAPADRQRIRNLWEIYR